MSTPILASTRAELAAALGTTPTALVPTMGALHEGHASLMRVARERVGAGSVVVSIFVNPLQFGAGEDLDRYPRTLEADLKVCEAEGVDVVFAPSVDEVYPDGPPEVMPDPGPRGDILEGRTRPGHFRGMLTVVAKLFGLVRPDLAVFGEKDYQQLTLIRRMVTDLCLGVEVVGAPTVRESDGLALSSRNAYLDPEQRHCAVALIDALAAAREDAADGLAPARDAAWEVLREADGVDLDYLEFRTPELDPLPDDATGAARVLIAARVGTTRLIDNLALTIGAR